MKKSLSSSKTDEQKQAIQDLFEALLLLKNSEEIERFFKDLCTPQEIITLAERWRVCRLLAQENLSYREINQITGASLATIGRVARFLKTEPHQGYHLVLTKLRKKLKILNPK